jgi:HAD superfamily hydrolase (TIGR01490 family)
MAEPERAGELDRATAGSDHVAEPTRRGRRPVMGPDAPEPPVANANAPVREAAFFDLDKTLLPGAALWPLAQEMYRQGVITIPDVARMARDQILFRLSGAEDMEKAQRARDASLAAVKGRARSEIAEFGRRVALEELMPRLYPQAVELINRHKRAGREVFVCSASPEDYLQVLAQELDMDGVVGTRAEVVDGVYTGRMLGDLCHGAEKARRVAELSNDRDIDLNRSFAYSDSVNDLPMLRLVGFPVAMNPDRALRQIARREGWQRLDFRTARRRTLLASYAGGVGVASGAVGYVLGYVVGRSRTQPATG